MDELSELIKLIESHIFEDRSFGTYRVLPTGKLMPTDNTYIEVLINGKSSYAKPCMPFGMYRVPSEKWLEAHKGKVVIWVTFEHGNPAHPVWIGMCPLDNQVPENKNYPDVAVFTTENFIFEFDDINEYAQLNSTYRTRKLHIMNNIFPLPFHSNLIQVCFQTLPSLICPSSS